MIDDARAREQGLAVGDRSELRSSGGAALDLVVHGVFERPLPLNWLLGKVVVAQAAFSAAPPGRRSGRPRQCHLRDRLGAAVEDPRHDDEAEPRDASC